ncbi:MAG: NAD(P)/FAD-dependent oxidoreductase [Candidatus Berkiellales bacterium]
MISFDVIIIGAGAAGLMCAIEAGKRRRKVLVIEHANKPGKKILMSGGGRCNFTNKHIHPENYLSHNPHFFKSALSRYTQWDFIDLVKKHHIAFHEKNHGQLFCDHKSKEILDMLLLECEQAGVTLHLNEPVKSIEKIKDNYYLLQSDQEKYGCHSLVIASGGLSIPTMGASGFGYKIAEQFGIKVWPTRAGLVPFTLHPEEKERYAILSGISCDSIVTTTNNHFHENILFTHRGLSGPAILQISNYWKLNEALSINLMPNKNLVESLKLGQRQRPNQSLKEFLSQFIAKRIVLIFLDEEKANQPLQLFTYAEFERISELFQKWSIKPNGTEGYRTAEVTLGGVDCHAISSKTMESNAVKGLYFIGEVLDVTGWLGGYNFQWAWSSGWAAGQVV